MHKLLSLSIMVILILGGFGVTALPKPNYEINQKNLSVSFSQILLKEKDNSITVELEGTNSILMRKNHYMVPTLIETFTFPFGTEITSVQCIPKNIHKQILTKELMVTPEPVILGQTSINEKSQRIENPISIDTWYEYDVGTGINQNERCIFLKVQIFPIQYYPSENTIEWAKNIEVEIQYIEPAKAVSFEDEYAFIVLSPSEYSGKLQDLITHKNNRGISTKLVILDEIYNGDYFPVEGRDNQEKIKYFIKNTIENWGTQYVLLVGSDLKFPTRDTHVLVDSDPPDDEVFVSDLYYADIYNETGSFSNWDTNENNVFGEFDWGDSLLTDEVDLYPDVYLGRLACVDLNEVETCVNKIINYETNEAFTQEWFTNLILIGGDSFPDDSGISEGEYVNEAVINIMDGFIPEKLWASNGALSGIPSGKEKIIDAFNEGAGFVDFSGHGNTYVYATHPYEDSRIWLPTPTGGFLNSQASVTNNGDKLPIIVTGACSVSKFNKDDDCFSWSFISNPNGGGIGSFGSTGLGWAYTGKGVTRGLVEKMSLNIFEAYNEEGAITFGEMWGWALNSYITPRMEGADYKTVEEWQAFGDPTLAVRGDSQAPAKPETPDGDASGRTNQEYVYTASTTDSDGDKLYYLFDWGDGNLSGWIGPYNSGEIVEASHIWEEEGEYQIKVKAKDIHGVQSEWSDPLQISMPKNKQSINTYFFDYLERFPRLFPIIWNILGFGKI